jgi:hypothetical protein
VADDQEAGRLERAVADGADLASKLVGASASLVLGPDGAFMAPAVEWASSHVLHRLGSEVLRRVGLRASVRTGAATIVIAADAAERRDRGDAPRGDEFFQPRGGHRPDNEELLEGVLLQAAQTYEERKVGLLAHLYDGVVFAPTVSPDQAQYLLKLADRLTYRQLVALSVLGNEEHVDDLAAASIRRDEGSVKPSDAIQLEIDDLADQGVIGVRVEGGDEIARPGELWGSSGRASAKPFQDLKPTAAGLLLCDLMRLRTIGDEDRASFLAEL